MGIDTKDRRKSVVNWFLRLLPSPDTIIDTADRAHIVGLYRGLFAALHTLLVTSDLLIFTRKLKSFTSDIIISISQIVTDDRRKSVTNSIIRILPFPDGVIDREDRRHVAGFYRRVTYTLRDISISVDVLIKKFGIVKSLTSDLIIRKLGILSITSDLLIRKLGILSITSDLLIYIQSIISLTSDLIIKKRNILSLTSDVIIEGIGRFTEGLNLKSYINISEDISSYINKIINKDSTIINTISLYSEIDSDISIMRYSKIDLDVV